MKLSQAIHQIVHWAKPRAQRWLGTRSRAYRVRCVAALVRTVYPWMQRMVPSKKSGQIIATSGVPRLCSAGDVWIWMSSGYTSSHEPPLDLQDTRRPRRGAATLPAIDPGKVTSERGTVRQAEERATGLSNTPRTAPRLAEERVACANMHVVELRWRYIGRRPGLAREASFER
jgi:hypothetical protein